MSQNIKLGIKLLNLITNEIAKRQKQNVDKKNLNLKMKKCTRQLQVRVRSKFKTNKFSDWIKLEITCVARENKKHTIGGKGKEIVV